MSRHALVVDDEPGIRFALRGLLEDRGFQVDEQSSGERALEALQLERDRLAGRTDQRGDLMVGQREDKFPTGGRVVPVLTQFEELVGQASPHARAQGDAQAADLEVAACDRLLAEAICDRGLIVEEETQQGARDLCIEDGGRGDGHVLARGGGPQAALAEDIGRAEQA